MDKMFQLKSENPVPRSKKPVKNILASESSQAARTFSQAQKLEHINNRGKEGRGRKAKS